MQRPKKTQKPGGSPVALGPGILLGLIFWTSFLSRKSLHHWPFLFWQNLFVQENFDALPFAPGTVTASELRDLIEEGNWEFAFENNANYQVDDGDSNSGGIKSLGSDNTPSRALGSLASGSTGDIFYGACVQIPSNGNALSSLLFSYTGRQFRDANLNQQSLVYYYTVDSSITSDGLLSQLELKNPSGWIQDSALNFISVQALNPSAKKLEPPLSEFYSDTLSNFFIPPGSWFCFKWMDRNDPGSDHALAIDDLSIKGLIGFHEIASLPDKSLSCDSILYPPNPFVNSTCPGVQLSRDSVFIQGKCPGEFQLLYTFHSIDSCGGADSLFVSYEFYDLEKPVFLNDVNSLDTSITCFNRAEFIPVIPQAYDNCDSEPDVMLVQVDTIFTEGIVEMVLSLNYLAVDNCGNRSDSFTQRIQYFRDPDVRGTSIEICPGDTIIPGNYIQSNGIGELRFGTSRDTIVDTLPARIFIAENSVFYIRQWLPETNCEHVDSFIVEILPDIDFRSFSDSICANDSVRVDLSRYEHYFTSVAGDFNYFPQSEELDGQIFFSEYLEGRAFDKCLELYNPGRIPINLERMGFRIQIYTNGSLVPIYSIPLTGIVEAASTMLICHNRTDSTILRLADLSTQELNFNGDDAIVLSSNSGIQDAIGRIGEDPGSAWGSGIYSTRDNLLRRSFGILTGDRVPSDPFMPELEWLGHAINDYSDLNHHEADILFNETPLIDVSNQTIYSRERFRVIFSDSVMNCTTEGLLDLRLIAVPELRFESAENSCPDKFLDLRKVAFTALHSGQGCPDTSYYTSAIEAIHGMNPLPDTRVEKSGMYYIRYSHSSCPVIDSFYVSLSSCPQNCRAILEDSRTLCLSDGTVELIYRFIGTETLSDSCILYVNEHLVGRHNWQDTSSHRIEVPDEIMDSIIKLRLIDKGSGGIVISEFLADPDPENGDSNGDGIISSTDDEFIELFNVGAISLSLAGMEIWDSNSLRHIFNPEDSLYPQQLIVVFGASDSLQIHGATAYSASSGGLSLNNDGDRIRIIRDNLELWSYEYGSEASQNQSLVNFGMDVFVPHRELDHSKYQSPGIPDGIVYNPGMGISGYMCEDRKELVNPFCPNLDTFDLDLSLSFSNDLEINPGDRISYNIIITNNGTVSSSAARIRIQLPTGLDFTNPEVIDNCDSRFCDILIGYLDPGEDSCIALDLLIDPTFPFSKYLIEGNIEEAFEADMFLITGDRDGIYGCNNTSPFENEFVHEEIICGNSDYSKAQNEQFLYCRPEELPDSLRIYPRAIHFSDELFFSRYLEGNLHNKVLELYNNSSAECDLSAYTIELYFNGNTTPDRIQSLNGRMGPGDSFLIVHEEADSVLRSIANVLIAQIMNFNGDDAIVLRKGSFILDVIGRVGEDPGLAWSSSGVSTKDQWLVRKPMIQEGDREADDSFYPDMEWLSYEASDLSIIPAYVKDTMFVAEYRFFTKNPLIFADTAFLKGKSLLLQPLQNSYTQEFWIVAGENSCSRKEVSTIQLSLHSDDYSLDCPININAVLNADCSLDLETVLLSEMDVDSRFVTIQLFNNQVELNYFTSLEEYVDSSLQYTIADHCSGNSCSGTIRIRRSSSPLSFICPCSYADSTDSIKPECIWSCLDEFVSLAPVPVSSCVDLPELIWEVDTIRSLVDCNMEMLVLNWQSYLPDGNLIRFKQAYYQHFIGINGIQINENPEIIECADPLHLMTQKSESSGIWPYFVNRAGDTLVWYDTSRTFCHLNATFNDVIIQSVNCNSRVSMYRLWSFTDWCSLSFAKRMQRFQFRDTIPPVIQLTGSDNNEPDFSLQLLKTEVDDPYNCGASLALPSYREYVSDDCTRREELTIEFEIPDNSYWYKDRLYGLKPGISSLVLKATDRCGNSSRAAITIFVTDKASPLSYCRDIDITSFRFTSDEKVRIPVSSFDAGSEDLCGPMSPIRLARRLDNKFLCGTEVIQFVSTDYIEFCCQDIGKEIPVRLTVFDIAGNSSSCKLNVRVSENILPEFYCRDTLIDCRSDISPESLGYPDFKKLTCQSLNLFWRDSLVQNKICANDFIYRIWTDSLSKHSCTQKIIISKEASLKAGDLRLPLHRDASLYCDVYALDDAGSSPGNARYIPILVRHLQGDRIQFTTARDCSFSCFEMPDAIDCHDFQPDLKIIQNISCSPSAVSYRDMSFANDGDTIEKIIRKWTVIDWCSPVLFQSRNPDNICLIIDSIEMRNYFQPCLRDSMISVIHFDQLLHCTFPIGNLIESTPFIPPDTNRSLSEETAGHSIRIEEKKNMPDEDMFVWPNPFSDILNIEILSPKAEEAQLKFYDLSGRWNYSRNVYLNEGINKIRIRPDLWLHSKIYILQLSTPNKYYSTRLVRIN